MRVRFKLGNRKNSFRFSLSIGVCMCLSIPALAQNTFDPFAPNVVAPSEPTAVPTAPTPVAPKLPPRPVPVKPVSTPEPIIVPEPTTEAAPPPASQVEPAIAEPIKTPTVTAEPEPSFFDKLGNLFETDKADDKTPAQPAKEAEEIVSEQPKPETPVIEIKPVITEKPKPAPKTSPEVIVQTQPIYQIPADLNNKDPFAPTSVAPALPTSTPQAPAAPIIIVEEQEPVVIEEPSTPVVVEHTPEPEKDQKVIQTEPVQEMVEAEPNNEPSFFEKIGNLFSSDEKPVLEETEQSVPAPEPTEYKAPEAVETVGKTTIIETPESNPEKGFFERLFGSEEAKPGDEMVKPVDQPTVVEESETTEPKPVQAVTKIKTVEKQQEQPSKSLIDKLIRSEATEPQKEIVETATKPTSNVVSITPEPAASNEPFATNAVAPSLPTNTPTAPKPVERLETAQPTSDTPPSKGFFDRLAETFKSDDQPVVKEIEATPMVKPVVVEVKDMPEVKVETVIAKAEPEGPGLFERIGSFFKDTFEREQTPPEKSVTEKNVEEKASEETSPPAVPQVQSPPAEPKAAPKPTDPRLAKAQLGLGKNIKLGQPGDDLSSKAKCFTKNRGTVAYCLTPTNWPSQISSHFDVSSHLYKGTQGIVQFDGDIATRLFSLFDAKGFEDIVKYYEKTLGPASNTFQRKTRTFKLGVIENPTYVWHKATPEDGLTEIFEIRKIADTRGSIPDIQRGSIRVYFEGAREIFSLTSDLDYMNLR